MLHDLWFQLRTALRRRSVEDDLDEEVRFHLDRETAKHVAQGVAPAEARRRARLSFGQLDVVKDDCRQAWGLRQLDASGRNLRYAFRRVRRAPGFTGVAVITLALGIGATTAVFSVVDAVLVRPLPYGEPGRLVALWPQQAMSNAHLVYLRERAQTFGEIASVAGWSMSLTGTDNPTVLRAERVSGNLFETLRARPFIGRTFTDPEGAVGAAPVVVLSHALWQERFGGEVSALDQTMVIDGTPHTVVGVMPTGFQTFGPRTDVWVPLPLDADAWYHSSGVSRLIARLEPGGTLVSAQSEFASLIDEVRREFDRPDDYGAAAVILSLHEAIVGGAEPTLVVLQGTAVFILLIAGANVTHLLLMQAVGRTREMAVRAAGGAGLRQVVGQLLAENVLLTAAGGLLGVAVAWWAVHGLVSLLPADLPRAGTVDMNLRVLLACFGTSAFIGAVVGFVPALLTLRGSPQALLRSSAGAGEHPRSGRGRWVLVTTEVALAVMLFVGAGLMLQTMWRLGQVDLGFRGSGVLTLRLQPVGPRTDAAAYNRSYYGQVFEQIAAVPGVEAVGAVQHLPLSGTSWSADLEIEGRPQPRGSTPPSVSWRLVAHDYFRAMGVRLIEGRLFSEIEDRPGSTDVVLVNEALARLLTDARGPLGRRIRAGSATDERWATVVGVVSDVRHTAIRATPTLEIYRPYPQASTMPALMLAVRTSGDPTSLAPTIRAAVWSVDRNAPISEVRPMLDLVSASISQSRAVTWLLVLFATVGLTLSVIGISAVATYAVRRRRREIGVRLALGATPPAVVRLVTAEQVRPAIVGLSIGLAGALLLARAMENLVYGVSARDATTYFVFAGAVLMAVTVASYACARRAASIDPAVALREE